MNPESNLFKLVNSVLDPKVLRSIEFTPNSVTFHFVDGGTIIISSPLSASMFDSMQVSTNHKEESE